jgi:K(+)-stimulated pyrophosphate-energized sodium pump
MILALVLTLSVAGLCFAFGLARHVLAQETGPESMRTIADAIKEGAEAFLRRQYKTITMLAAALAVALFLLYAFVKGDASLAVKTTISFILGAACSGLAGWVGMYVSIRANVRTACAATKSLDRALKTALRGGAVSGLSVVALSLLGVGGLFLAFGGASDDAEVVKRVPFLIVGYGFGASFVALFAQLGGGIYTKAADVGADLVGKVEAGIPEDDPRNPAVIADLVGDNVGDCAGRGADLFESTAAENIGAMILGVGLFPFFGVKGVLFPLVARALGLVASILGVMIVSVEGDEDPMKSLNRGYFVTSAAAAAGFIVAANWLLQSERAPHAWGYFAACGVIGLATAVAFVYITQYYTEYRYRPVRFIAQQSTTGPATNIIAGFSVALECTLAPVIVISAAIVGSYYLGMHSGVENGGLYGTAVATMGMLGTAGYILAMDTFGPITDNAGGIVEMSQQPEEIRKKTDRLDAVGNTTKALTKGYAIGSAALAAFLLFSAYLDEVYELKHRAAGGEGLDAALWKLSHTVDLARPEVFVGGLLGAMLVFLFSGLAIRAVGSAANSIITEVRRQFKEKPGILEGKDRPDYGSCVDIVTRAALRQMVLPGLVAVGMPIAVGLIFKAFGVGAEAVAALLMVGTIAGILLATVLNNGGGAWDNAKKYIETGAHGGKRSETHKAAVVGDTVGDPFKDTAGPSLHVLIKLLSTITLVLAPLFI